MLLHSELYIYFVMMIVVNLMTNLDSYNTVIFNSAKLILQSDAIIKLFFWKKKNAKVNVQISGVWIINVWFL